METPARDDAGRDQGAGGPRVGDADRARVIAVLQQHCSDGRISLDELADRIADVYAARSWVELDATLRDLPRTPPSLLAERERHVASLPERRPGLGRWRSYVVINAFLIAIWALTGMGYFWPMWVLLGLALPLLLGRGRGKACGRHLSRF